MDASWQRPSRLTIRQKVNTRVCTLCEEFIVDIVSLRCALATRPPEKSIHEVFLEELSSTHWQCLDTDERDEYSGYISPWANQKKHESTSPQTKGHDFTISIGRF